MRQTIIDAVLFDFDATLTRPGAIDFGRIRSDLGCPPDVMILDFVNTLPSEVARGHAMTLLNDRERDAADASEPAEGAEELVYQLRSLGYRVGILTRNTTDSVLRALRNFQHLSPSDFHTIVSRDDPPPVKPHGDSVRYAASDLGVMPERLLMVGDYRHDIDAGRQAGSWTCLIHHGRSHSWTDEVPPDYEVSVLGEIPAILSRHRRLPTGKLPNNTLAGLLAGTAAANARTTVLLGPGIGRDFAVVQTDTDGALAIACDPVTFATDGPGRFLVTVNANDLACSGADPQWLTVCALFPPETTILDIASVFEEIDHACSNSQIALVAGHTEITDAVTRTVLSGTLIGGLGARKETGPLAHRFNPYQPRVQDGDRILMTKSAGIEGTLILATEYPRVLRHRGVSAAVIDTVMTWHPRLSILPEAAIVRSVPGLRLLHDVTEGGVASAVRELTTSAGITIAVDANRIAIADETKLICRAVNIDPLGLIGSGSLLVIVSNSDTHFLQESLQQAGIESSVIGTVTKSTIPGIEGSLPEFGTDELSRFVERGL